MTLPLIGLTSSRGLHNVDEELKFPNHNSIMSVSEAYTAAILRSGGFPVIIPMGLSQESLATAMQRLDGLLFTGGGDVHPGRYGNPIHPLVSGIDDDRDEVEFKLLKECLRLDKPFLGICRGLQMINVAMGGTLYEDLWSQRQGSQKHRYSGDTERRYLAHPVQIEENSTLHSIVEKSVAEVNSLHHQGVRQLAPGLRPSAYAPDGLVEAFELPGHSFGLAVQWHPEWLPTEANMDGLFQHLVLAAAKNSSRPLD